VENAWYEYKEKWYYLGTDCAMATGLRVIEGKAYYFHEDGSMAVAGEKVTLVPNAEGVLK